MDDFDHADLDGDGEFDAIDISIMEDEASDGKKPSVNGKSGCCVIFLVIGASVSAGWWC